MRNNCIIFFDIINSCGRDHVWCNMQRIRFSDFKKVAILDWEKKRDLALKPLVKQVDVACEFLFKPKRSFYMWNTLVWIAYIQCLNFENLKEVIELWSIVLWEFEREIVMFFPNSFFAWLHADWKNRDTQVWCLADCGP